MNNYLAGGIGVLALALGAYGSHYIDTVSLAKARADLSSEQAAHARDNGQCVANAAGVSELAAKAAIAANAATATMERDRDTALDQLHTLQASHVDADSKYLFAVTAGTVHWRVRVAPGTCSATNTSDTGSSGGVPGNPGSASVNDGTDAYADIDPAVAGRIGGVLTVDQQQINHLQDAQAWACSIKPELAACKVLKNGH